MRSDGVKSRERLLVAAGQVVEEKWLGAIVTDVARVAGALPHRPLSQNEVDHILSKRHPSPSARSGGVSP